MSTTLTIRNLDAAVKQKLRVRAALHGRSMEAEARAILSHDVLSADARPPAGTPGKFDHVAGIWKGRMSTNEIMNLTRGE